MISMGRKMHWPSACTAGTLSTSMAITSPMAMKAMAVTVKASRKASGCAGSGMPRGKAQRQLQKRRRQQQP